MIIKAILSLNFQQYTLHWSLFSSSADRKLYNGYIDYLDLIKEENGNHRSLSATRFCMKNTLSNKNILDDLNECTWDKSIDKLISSFDQNEQVELIGVGHRIINGGKEFNGPMDVNDSLIKYLRASAISQDLDAKMQMDILEYIHKKYPKYIQVACFDNSFYTKINKDFSSSEKTQRSLLSQGLNGLACESILYKIDDITNIAAGNIIIVNLGENYSSVCSISNRLPIGFRKLWSRLDNLIRVDSVGNIDATTELCLMEYGQSTSQGPYNISSNKSDGSKINDTNLLKEIVSLEEESLTAKTNLSIDMFCSVVAAHISSLIPSLSQLDAIIFTSCIGENSPLIRNRICKKMAWFGVQINEAANKSGFQAIAKKNSKVKLFVLPANEEETVAIHSSRLIFKIGQGIEVYS